MATAVMMPRIGLNETENLIGEFFIKEGDVVSAGDELFSVETDKSSLTVEAEVDGIIVKCFYEAFDSVQVLTPVCVIGREGEDVSEISANLPGKSKVDIGKSENLQKPVTDNATIKDFSGGSSAIDDIIRISPRAKHLAESNGIEYSNLTPHGAENRIIESDIIAVINGTAEYREGSAGESMKFTKIRKLIADNMMNSLRSTAQLTHHTIFDASKINELREEYKADGKKVSIGDLIMFGLSRTLLEFSEINAHMVNDDEIIIHKQVNLGMAVDTPRGLLVPTIMNAGRLSIEEISSDVKQLAAACRDGSIGPDRLRSATFTISNLGNMGVQYFTPILNPPQVGILGVGTIDYQVRKTSYGMEFYPAGHLSLTYDHRAIDGAPASRFLKALCVNLENIKAMKN